MKKKLISVLLAVCLTVAVFVPCLVFPTAADNVAAEHPSKVVYDFSDWDDHCVAVTDKFSTLATGVIGINGDPALNVMPLKQAAGSFGWDHFLIPFAFEDGKTYIISYDITLLSQLGKDTPDATVKWNLWGSASAEAYGSNMNAYKAPITKTDGTDLDGIVKSGEWTHVVAQLAKPEGDWKVTDCLFFWEEAINDNTSNSQIAIDNLVIMEKTEYEVTYPNGVEARTDTPAVDMIASNFNVTRAMPFLDTVYTGAAASAVIDGDGRMKWNYKANTNVFTAFHFEAGKTYHFSCDVALDVTHAEKYPDGVTLKPVAMDSSDGVGGDGVETFTGGQTLVAGKWTHLEMTLTPKQAHGFFGMTMETAPVVTTTVFWFDNVKIYVDGKEPSCPTTPHTGDAASSKESYKLLTNFEDGRNMLHSGHWYWSAKGEIVTLENGNTVEKVRMSPWSRLFGLMSFAKDKTYVISFDVYGVSDGNGNVLPEGETLTGNLNLFAHPDGTGSDRSQFSYPAEDGTTLIGNLKVVSGQWRHYTVTTTIAKASYYFSFWMMGGENVVFYLDNLTVAEKTDCDTKGHVAGIWIDDAIPSCSSAGHSKLYCAVCGAVMEEKDLPKSEHIKGTEQIVVTEPDCTHAGSYKYECVICHETVTTGDIPALGHTPGQWETVTEADCHTEGSEASKCTVCGEVLDTRAIPKLNHIEGKWVVDKEAAPGVAGHRHKTCTLCGDVVREEEIPALPAEETTVAETTGTSEPSAVGCDSTISGIAGVFGILMAAGVMLGRKKKHD